MRAFWAKTWNFLLMVIRALENNKIEKHVDSEENTIRLV
jgi:hypothetical protein